MSARLNGDQSLDVELAEGEGQTWLDRLPCTAADQEYLLIENQETQNRAEAVEQALKTLNEREQEIIRARILTDAPVTLQHLAEHFSISRERVRQIEKLALQRLRACMEPQVAE